MENQGWVVPVLPAVNVVALGLTISDAVSGAASMKIAVVVMIA